MVIGHEIFMYYDLRQDGRHAVPTCLVLNPVQHRQDTADWQLLTANFFTRRFPSCFVYLIPFQSIPNRHRYFRLA